MVETTAVFRASADVVARDIPEGLMLVNVQTGAAFKLNQVGAAVWKQFDGISDIAAITADLARRYGVELETLVRDLNALLEDLQRQGLIVPADPG